MTPGQQLRELVAEATVQIPGAPSALFARLIERCGYDAIEIPGTEDAGNVFFSPDGAWLGFQSGELLRKLPLGGGPAQTLAKPGRGWRGATWGPDGRIFLGWRTHSEQQGRQDEAELCKSWHFSAPLGCLVTALLIDLGRLPKGEFRA